jgi:hypothetical protein
MKKQSVLSNSSVINSRWSRELIPVFLVFPFSILFSIYLHDPDLQGLWTIIYRNIIRFFRYAFSLCLPLYVLHPIYKMVLEKGRDALIQLREPEALTFHPLKHWLFRPFQGIGIGFLFATKLLALIETLTGPLTSAAPPLISGRYYPVGLLLVTGITVVMSLLLSVLWTMDDMGIRYHNRRDQELKMIGKYVGTLMPLIFGLYGLLTLLTHFPRENVLVHVFRIILAFYPPMVFFVIFHFHFINRRTDFHSRKGKLKKGGVWKDKRNDGLGV